MTCGIRLFSIVTISHSTFRFEVYLMFCKFCLTGLPLFIRWQLPTLNIESLMAACINVATIVLVGNKLPYRHSVDAIMQQGAQAVIGLIVACGMGEPSCRSSESLTMLNVF